MLELKLIRPNYFPTAGILWLSDYLGRKETHVVWYSEPLDLDLSLDQHGRRIQEDHPPLKLR